MIESSEVCRVHRRRGVPPSSSIQGLPLELLQAIFTSHETRDGLDRQDFCSLRSVCKRLNALATPLLFERLTICLCGCPYHSPATCLAKQAYHFREYLQRGFAQTVKEVVFTVFTAHRQVRPKARADARKQTEAEGHIQGFLPSVTRSVSTFPVGATETQSTLPPRKAPNSDCRAFWESLTQLVSHSQLQSITFAASSPHLPIGMVHALNALPSLSTIIFRQTKFYDLPKMIFDIGHNQLKRVDYSLIQGAVIDGPAFDSREFIPASWTDLAALVQRNRLSLREVHVDGGIAMDYILTLPENSRPPVVVTNFQAQYPSLTCLRIVNKLSSDSTRSEWFQSLVRQAPSLTRLELSPLSHWSDSEEYPVPTDIPDIFNEASTASMHLLEEVYILPPIGGRSVLSPIWNPLCRGEAERIFHTFGCLPSLQAVHICVGQLDRQMLSTLSAGLRRCLKLSELRIDYSPTGGGRQPKGWSAKQIITANHVFEILPALADYPLTMRQLTIRLPSENHFLNTSYIYAIHDFETLIAHEDLRKLVALTKITFENVKQKENEPPKAWKFLRRSVGAPWHVE